MPLTLYYHPLSSFCMKVLIALYENDTPFTPRFVDPQDATARAELLDVWKMGKLPVLKDGDWTVPESTIIIEYLDQKYPGKTKFIPADPDLARQMRMRERFFDLYVMDPMFRIVGDRLRPEGKHDAYGVEQYHTMLDTALGMIDKAMAEKTWAIAETFTMADCAAGPSLFYANKVAPFESTHPHAAGYLDRLKKRPSFARALKEAEPYMHMFPE
jgi:glutathione S-transferase